MHRAAPAQQGAGAYRKIRGSQRAAGTPGKGTNSTSDFSLH